MVCGECALAELFLVCLPLSLPLFCVHWRTGVKSEENLQQFTFAFHRGCSGMELGSWGAVAGLLPAQPSPQPHSCFEWCFSRMVSFQMNDKLLLLLLLLITILLLLLTSGIRYHCRNRLGCFLGFCSLLLLWMECTRCLYKFVQMIAEPEKSIAATDAIIGPLIQIHTCVIWISGKYHSLLHWHGIILQKLTTMFGAEMLQLFLHFLFSFIGVVPCFKHVKTYLGFDCRN